MARARVPPQALERWMDEHGSRVRAIAEVFAGGAVEPDDIFQETFIRAWDKGAYLLSDENGRQVRAWLCRVAANVGRSAREKRRRRAGLLKRWSIRAAPPRPPPRSIAQEMHLTALWRIVEALPERQQAVLLSRTVGGASTREIAEELGITEGTVRATLRDALCRVRREVSSYGEADRAAI